VSVAMAESKDYRQRANQQTFDAVLREIRLFESNISSAVHVVTYLCRLGWPAVPVIMEMLAKKPDSKRASLLCQALREITGETPGDLEKSAAEHWLDWWKRLGPCSDRPARGLPQSLRLVSCANCRQDLMGESMRYRFRRPPVGWPAFVAGRCQGRPYCKPCLELVTRLGYGGE